MYLKELEINGFKSFAKKSNLEFGSRITSIVGPNGSGKSNVAESFRFVLGEQSIKSMRGKKGGDLIFNGANQGQRLNRASVKVTFDNTNRVLDVDFDEVTIERIVHRDGVNDYTINGSPARLKDISELLAKAHIGSSGHHIISQGEADRILNASSKERREILEDALGLRVYQYKKTESERKLEKTHENIDKVQSLRREIAPHIKFLKKQVEKIEKSKELQEKLKETYKEYLTRESVYIKHEQEEIAKSIEGPQKELQSIEDELNAIRKTLSEKETNTDSNNGISELEARITEHNQRKNALLRQSGELVGEISALQKMMQRVQKTETEVTVNFSEVESLLKDISNEITAAQEVQDIGMLRSTLQKIKQSFSQFVDQYRTQQPEEEQDTFDDDINALQDKKAEIDTELSRVVEAEKELQQELQAIKQKLDEEKTGGLEAEKRQVELLSRQNEVRALIGGLNNRKEVVARDAEELKREVEEGRALIGRDVYLYEQEESTLSKEEICAEDRDAQRERRRSMERMKIRLEEMGGNNADEVLTEFKEATERDTFLIQEIEDLEKSSASLKDLIAELEETINTKFKEGITKINSEFQTYFELMFGGGTAKLNVVQEVKRKRRDTELNLDPESVEMPEDDEAQQEGIEIAVSLPRKKIKGLMMLSGGERALTSIALIFAMSAVNPPPFIILDETDAALDEANSKKYGDMIENLSKHSQLILITHNRETMSRASILYGVTMSSNGISDLLSIKFDEGVQFAK